MVEFVFNAFVADEAVDATESAYALMLCCVANLVAELDAKLSSSKIADPVTLSFIVKVAPDPGVITPTFNVPKAIFSLS
tara:strand:- start:244 stop:480 length:237 start_codon:yes stop_codon:yes gene_type:complete